MNSSYRAIFQHVRLPRNRVANRTCTYSVDATEIQRPKRIERGPTDVLKALSGTVGIDSTAAHYKFHDDPYLMPYSNPTKRSYALSQEAGRKAARWIRQQHSDLFQHNVADPMIEALIPNVDYNESSEVDEELLRSLINKQQVSDAINVYEILKKRGVALNVTTKHEMLALTCYYNNQDPLSAEWIEENWFRQGTQNRSGAAKIWKKVWKDGGFAEKLFDNLIQNGGEPSKAYSSLIAGMMKHGEIDRGWKLYEECNQKGVQLSIEVYNAIIGKTSFIKESHDMVWQLVLKLLSEIEAAKIKPNLETMNGILQTLEIMATNRNAKANSLSTISEFRQLGIEPSLASYAYLIKIFRRDKSQLSGVVDCVLRQLEMNLDSVNPRAPDDNTFFMSSMESIGQLGDRELAARLDKLLHNARNYSLIGTSFSESIYYRNYFLTVLRKDSFDDFMNFYESFVPNIYVPEVSITLEVLKTIEVHLAWKYIPKMWTDIVLFDQVRVELVGKLLSLTVEAVQSDSQLALTMANVTWSVWQKIESGTIRNFEWTGEMLNDTLYIFVLTNELPKAHLVMDKIDRAQDSYTGEPSKGALTKYVDACVSSGSIDSALKCIRYCDSRGRLETEALLVKVLNSGMHLDEPQRRVVEALQQNM